MGTSFNWAALNREKPKGFNLKKYRKSPLDYLINKDKLKIKMDLALRQYGWKTCSRCGGGRHPYFKTCKKCSVAQMKLRN